MTTQNTDSNSLGANSNGNNYANENSHSATNSTSYNNPVNSSAAPTNGQGDMNAVAQNTGVAKSVVGIFQNINLAERAVSQLRSGGFSTEEINIISKGKESDNAQNMGTDSVMDGTMAGGAIGGIGGLLMSAGALAIPGFGPIIAAGPLAATIAGAVGGGITGGLIDWGIPSDKSEEYNNEIAFGKTLAVIRTDESKIQQAIQILTQNGAMNVETHNAR